MYRREDNIKMDLKDTGYDYSVLQSTSIEILSYLILKTH
jgi:hypothetical protein